MRKLNEYFVYILITVQIGTLIFAHWTGLTDSSVKTMNECIIQVVQVFHLKCFLFKEKYKKDERWQVSYGLNGPNQELRYVWYRVPLEWLIGQQGHVPSSSSFNMMPTKQNNITIFKSNSNLKEVIYLSKSLFVQLNCKHCHTFVIMNILWTC